MNHQTALSPRQAPDQSDQAPDCTGQLDPDGGGFWDDVRWVVYRCRGCNQRIATVGGGQHWWNHVLPRATSTEVNA